MAFEEPATVYLTFQQHYINFPTFQKYELDASDLSQP